MKITLNELRKIVRSVLKEEIASTENPVCAKFKLITKNEFLADVKNLFFSAGSDTDEAKNTVANSKKIYKFSGSSNEANKNLACIGLTLYKSQNYDFYEPDLYSKTKLGYFYIGVW